MTIAMTAEIATARMIGSLVAEEATRDAEEGGGELRERVESRRQSCLVSSRSALLTGFSYFLIFVLVLQRTGTVYSG